MLSLLAAPAYSSTPSVLLFANLIV